MGTSGNEAVSLERFGGLRNASDPEEYGFAGATDMLNVVLSPDTSKVSTRAGSATFGGTAITDLVRYIFPSGTPGTLPGRNVYLTGINGTTAFLDNFGPNRQRLDTWTAVALGPPPQIVTFGTPAGGAVYVCWPNTSLRKFAGTGSNAPGKPGYIAVSPQSNRLVQAWFGAVANSPTGATGSASAVFFSDAGAPDTYSANNFVQLRPNDGEEITGMVVWRDLLFVFKQSFGYIFYGESTDASGNPIFNYRQISLDSPIPVNRNFIQVVAGDQGVYYTASDGVYRTTGGQPSKVSQNVNGHPLFEPGKTSISVGHLSVAGPYVALNTSNGITSGHLLFDERNNEWTCWNLTPAGGTALNAANLVADEVNFPEDVFYSNAGQITKTVKALPLDTAALYQTGFGTLGDPAQKVIRETLIDAAGSFNLGYAVDWGTEPTGTAVTAGTFPQVAQARSRTAVKGRNFRLQVDSTSGAWQVNRVVPLVRSERGEGEGSK